MQKEITGGRESGHLRGAEEVRENPVVGNYEYINWIGRYFRIQNLGRPGLQFVQTELLIRFHKIMSKDAIRFILVCHFHAWQGEVPFG